MRITKITLRNFRGITDSTVEFGAGVTVVAGPNEAGKSSIAHAIRFIRESKASSRHRDIVAAKPIGRDVGPEVELELRTGPYELRFHKRWLKTPITELIVRSPKPEQLSGDEAHDRFHAILADTVDVDLLDALDVLQGQSLDQPDLAQITSLHHALDDSAGELDSHDVLLERIDAEFAKYFTSGGRPTGEYKSSADALPALQSDVDELTTRSVEMDRLTDEFTEVSSMLARLTQESEKSKTDLDDNQKAADGLVELREAVAAAERELEEADRNYRAATEALTGRADLIEDLRAREEATAEDSAALTVLQAKEADLIKAFATVRTDLETREKERDQKRAAARAANSGVEQKRDHQEKRELSGLVDRAMEAERQRVDAQGELEVANIDDEDLDDLTMLETDLRVAESARTAAAPNVIITPVAATRVEVGGETIPAGESFEVLALDTVNIEVRGQLLVEVRPGTPPAELDRNVADARKRLDEGLNAARVSTIADARELAARKREAAAALASSTSALAGILGDSTLEAFTDRLAVVIAKTSAEVGGEPKDDLATLEAQANIAAEDEETADKIFETAQAELERQRDAMDEARDKAVRARAALDVAEAERGRVAETLKEVRSLQDDSTLEKVVKDAAKALGSKQKKAKIAADSLEAADPDTIGMLFNNAQALVLSKDEEVKGARSRIDKLTALLEERESEGIYDKLAAAKSLFDATQTRYDRHNRSAEAVQLLRDTLRKQRDEAQKKYVAPFKAQIERLGRGVFGRDFQVEISNGLSVETRTLGGITVPFDQLSTGTKEQISLLGRLACAQLVDAGEGAPVILDDAMGFSDPARLTAVNAVLGEVGRTAQVVLLTCQPERFSGVGGARVEHVTAS
jgi:DNA repair exonuclease SbcCD ATPase subunit